MVHIIGNVKNLSSHMYMLLNLAHAVYVALSRCTSSHRIKVLLQEEHVECKTQNVVYPEVLLQQ